MCKALRAAWLILRVKHEVNSKIVGREEQKTNNSLKFVYFTHSTLFVKSLVKGRIHKS